MRREKRRREDLETNMTNTEASTEKAATVAAQGAQDAPKKAPSKKGATNKKGAPKGQRAAKGGKPKAAPKKPAKAAKKAAAKKGPAKARDGGKKAQVIELMRRKQGVTLAEIMELTGWQAHTVRGFISIAGSKQGLKIESFRGDDKARTYRIA